jgi:transposase
VADRIEIPLALDDFEVESTELIDDVLEVRVHSTFPAACFHCGSTSVRGHGRFDRRLRDRSRGCPTVLVWRQRRWACVDCGRTSRERHPQVCGGQAITARFRRQLFDEACRRPFAEVAADHRVSFYRVIEAFDALAPEAVIHDVGHPRVLSMDESAFRRGLQFQTVLFDPVARRALAVTDGRDQRSAERLLFSLSSQVRAGVETAVIDCHWPFRKAITEAMPHVRVVVDKFHVLRAFDAAAQRVRGRFGRKPRRLQVGRDGGVSRQHNPRNDPAIYRGRWVFMRRAGRLTERDRAELASMIATAPEIGVAYWMKEAFAAIYDSPDRAEAERRLSVWVANLEAAGLLELTQLWRHMQWWREEILAYFEDRQTNAFAEGVTNKIKVMKRRGYGYRNVTRYRHKILLTCRCRPPG